MSLNLYLFQKNLLMCVCVCYSVTASPAKTVGPMALIFGTIVGQHVNLMIFHSSRSEVKGQGKKMMFSACTVGGLKIGSLMLYPG